MSHLHDLVSWDADSVMGKWEKLENPRRPRREPELWDNSLGSGSRARPRVPCGHAQLLTRTNADDSYY
jgi:hypothetical protein